ncbi:hypothetical protein [Amnibacterium sp.]|uniref:hypothetical protein n=1 Tax=Amnibacterium sp. TaxID=1872496 RepID=UPI003F7C0309
MRRVAVLIGCCLPLLLTACTAASSAPRTTPAGPPVFPRVAGRVLSTTEAAPGDWVIRVRVADPVTAYERARALLTAKGYQLTNDEQAADGGQGQACSTALCVTFSALVRPGTGPVVEYEAFHSTGVVG